MAKKSSEKQILESNRAVLVGLAGLVSISLITPLSELLAIVTRPFSQCNSAYALGCSVFAMILVPPVYVALMTYFIGRVLRVKRAFQIVLVATIALLVTLFAINAATTYGQFELSSLTLWVTFAVLAGLLFAGLQRAFDKR